MSPKDKSITVSYPVSTNGSNWDLVNAIQNYYGNVFSAQINVLKVMYDATGAVTTSQQHSVQNVYTISVIRSITMPSATQITVTKVSTKSTISVILPKNL